MAGRITGKGQKQLGCIYEMQVWRKARKILPDPAHPLYMELNKVPSEDTVEQPQQTRTYAKEHLYYMQ